MASCCSNTSAATHAKWNADQEGSSAGQHFLKEQEVSKPPSIAGGNTTSAAHCCEEGEECQCNDDCLYEYASVLCSKDCGPDGKVSTEIEKAENVEIAGDDDLELILEEEEEVEDEDHDHDHGHEHGDHKSSHSHSKPTHSHHKHHSHAHTHSHTHSKEALQPPSHCHPTPPSRKRSFDEKTSASKTDCCEDRPAKKQCCKSESENVSKTGLSEKSGCCKPVMVDKGCCTEMDEEEDGCCGKKAVEEKGYCVSKAPVVAECCAGGEKKAPGCCGEKKERDDCCDDAASDSSSCCGGEDDSDADSCCESILKDDCCSKKSISSPDLKIEEIRPHRHHHRRSSITSSIRSAARSASEILHSIPESIKHHHHKFRYRRKTSHAPCSKHIAEATSLLGNKEKGKQTHPCFCRLTKEAASGTAASGFASTKCCDLRKKREIIKQICCTKTHDSRSGMRRSFLKLDAKPVEDEDKSVLLVLSVTGMTCSGCGAKMERTLAALPGVLPSTVRVSFLLSRAECRYDPTIAQGGGEQIGALVKQRTGFICAVLIEGGGQGELGARICVNTSTGGINKLHGVEGIGKIVISQNADDQVRDEIAKGKSYLIDYDPQVIGARDILTLTDGVLGGRMFGGMTEQERARKVARKHLWLSALRTLFATILTIPVAVLSFSKIEHISDVTKGAICLPLAVLVQASAYNLYENAVRTAFYQREIDMDVLVCISTSVAFIFSLVTYGFIVRAENKGIPSPLGDQEPLFETSTMLITLIFWGRLVTAWVRDRASRSGQSMEGLQQGSGILETKEGEVTVDARLLHYNDILVAEAGTTLVTDGVVVEGSAEMDESLITGEARPALRKNKARVLAGSTVVNGMIKYRVTRLVNENTISSVKKLVQIAATSRNRTQDLADKVASYLTPAVLIISAIIFMIWALVRVYVDEYPTTKACVNAITFAIATLAISCPCAIGLAIPMVLVVGTSLGLRRGIVFKSAVTVQNARGIRHAVFDKTGTLTNGKLEVQKEVLLVDEKEKSEILKLIWGLTSKDRHPVSVAVAGFVLKKSSNDIGEDSSTSWQIKQSIGNGLEATLPDGTILRGGKPSWVDTTNSLSTPSNSSLLEQFTSEGHSLFAFSRNSQIIAIFGLTDMLRPEGHALLRSLRHQGIQTHLISGDTPSAVLKVGHQLGFEPDCIRGGCLPQDKVDYITTLNNSTVLFVGDGNNDALALSTSAIGISMTHSADLASSSASVEILSDDLRGITLFLRLARRMRNMIIFNLAWSLLYNVFAILLAGGGLERVGFRIEPQWAGAGEMVSIAPVIVGGWAVGWFF